MNRKNFEIGIQRLYYALWIAWSIGGIISGILIANHSISEGGNLDLRDIATWIGLFLIAPPALMFGGRWIYRGFFPNA